MASGSVVGPGLNGSMINGLSNHGSGSGPMYQHIPFYH